MLIKQGQTSVGLRYRHMDDPPGPSDYKQRPLAIEFCYKIGARVGHQTTTVSAKVLTVFCFLGSA